MRAGVVPKESIRVLISCVGRQVSLVRQFQSALSPGGSVITADADRLAAGAAAADTAHVAPLVGSSGYGEWMVALCEQEHVSLLLTLLPRDLLELERFRQAFDGLGVRLVGMRPEVLDVCLDKRRLGELCESIGLKTPPVWDLAEVDRVPSAAYPLVAKEVAGEGSRGMVRLTDPAAAARFRVECEATGRVEQCLVQPVLDGYEYGLDLVNDLEGRPVATFVRRKLRMSNGETEIAETIDDDRLVVAGRELAERLGHQGLVDCDVMRCADGDYLLDINVRFGGGYIFSHEAGANVPGALVAWLRGERPDPAWLAPQPGVISARISGLQRISQSGTTIAIDTTGGHDIGMGHAPKNSRSGRSRSGRDIGSPRSRGDSNGV